MNKTSLPIIALLGACTALHPSAASAQDAGHLKLDSPWASFVEEDFPFFGHVLDAREFGGRDDNLTPRAVILNLGDGVHACFDTDLLRLALVWKETEDGEWLTMNSMAAGSYRLPQQKAPTGQKNLPKPMGTPLLVNGLYPGWHVGEGEPELKDPRDRGTAQEGEIGLGPLPETMGRWKGLRMDGKAVRIEYAVGSVEVSESISYHKDSGVVRVLSISAHQEPLQLVTEWKAGKPVIRTFAPSEKASIEVVTSSGAGDLTPYINARPMERWPETFTTDSKSLPSPAAYELREVGLPRTNPWKRDVRVSGFDFFSDGRLALCTFDGDVWAVSGLSGALDQAQWRRIASGLHEPMGLSIVDDQIYVFDRNAVMRLNDGKSEVVTYEAFCNLVPQTAETREFAMDIYAKPGGGFYISKGGQIGTTIGRFNGTVVEIAADGKSFRRVGFGLRQPYIGVDPKTGLVTASDQQGNWVPATPIHVIGDDSYHGFQPEPLKDNVTHPKAISEPPVWLPHFVNSSGASQVWLRDAKMGPLNDSLIHIGFNRPEIFKVYFDESGKMRQGAVAPVLNGFPSGLLKGRIHPVDGTLWLAGFKIWGTSAEQISGIYRVRMTKAPCWVPEDVRSSDRGVLLRFSQPVDPAIAANPASYSVDRWNYIRTHQYGSGNYKLDGKPGQESVSVTSAYLSRDGKAVFLGIPGMEPVHSLRVTYRVPDPSGQLPPAEAIQHAYLTIHQNNPIDLAREGFGDIEVDLKPKAGTGLTMAAVEPSIEIGKQMYLQYGCIACHTVDGSKTPAAVAGNAQVVVGPSWFGLWGAKKKFADGSELKAVDETYLRESILDPAKRVSEGFEMSKTGVGMPSYLGVLRDHEVDSLILYIQSLAVKKGKR